MTGNHCLFRGPQGLADSKAIFPFQWLECFLLLLLNRITKASCLFSCLLRYESGILRWEIFSWSLKPLALYSSTDVLHFGFYSECFSPHWRRYSQLLLFAFEVNLQRAFCSVSLPRKWQSTIVGCSVKMSPWSLLLLPFSTHSLPCSQTWVPSRVQPSSSLNDSEDSLSPLLLTFLGSLDSLYWAKPSFTLQFLLNLYYWINLWRPETSWK